MNRQHGFSFCSNASIEWEADIPETTEATAVNGHILRCAEEITTLVCIWTPENMFCNAPSEH